MRQELIWDHFQGEDIEKFSGAARRLNFLFRKALKLSKGEKLCVLNIGAGDGWLERHCLRQGWETHSLDPSAAAIQRLDDAGIAGDVGYIEKMPFGDEAFDVVFCSEVLEHLTDEQLGSGLREVTRVMRKGGYMIGTVPFNEELAENSVVCPDCGKVFHRWGHHQSFDKYRLRSEIETTGLIVLHVATYAFPDFSKRLPLNRLRQGARWILGRFGSRHVYTNLFFLAVK